MEGLVSELKSSFPDAEIDANFTIDDACCARYLRARNLNLTKAQKMLAETIEWRRSAKPTELPISLVKSEMNGKTFVSPHCDLEGRPIVVMRNRLEQTHDFEGNVAHLIYHLERAVKRTTDKWNLIIDFDGYSMRNAPPLKTSRTTLHIMQAHYPERLHKAFLIQPPFLFFAAFKAISPFIDPVTRDKIVFVRGSKQDQTALLAKHFPLSSLEKCLGGTSDYVFDADAYLADDAS